MRKFTTTLALVIVAVYTTLAQSPNTNYVKTTAYKIPTTDGVTARSGGANLTQDNKVETIQYFDGLGRAIQSINVQAGANKENIVQHFEYDEYGRQVKNYLPYATNGPVTVDALNMVIDPVSGINSYYQNNYSDDFTASILNPYSETEFENSPLNRALKQAAPGSDWSMGSGHEVKMDYQTNSISDAVRVFGVSFNDPQDKYEPTLTSSGSYQVGKLYKSIVKDENWVSGNDHTVEEFTDFQGKVILKRTYNDNQRHDTYYVYDDYGNLTYVIPPLGSDQILVQNRIWSISRVLNSPWTRIVNVNREFADNFDSLLSEFDNTAILNTVIANEYNGVGGFSVQNHNNGEYLSVSINFSVNQPMQLKTGYLQSLESLGDFEDTDIGVISGNNYRYNLSIKKNQLYISGDGELTSLQATVSNQTKRDYNINYPWVEFVEIDPEIRSNYLSSLKGVENSQLLSTIISNPYNGIGGLNVTVDSNDNVSIAMSASWDGTLPLKNGAVIDLDIDRSLEDRFLGNITTGGSDYVLELKNNRIIIQGEGNIIGISDNFVVGQLIRVTTIDEPTLQGLCYIYQYDHRNRLVEKKIPGKDWEHIVYDNLDRPILTQDGNQRLQGEWLFTKYDKLGRVVYTGIYNSSLSRKQIQQEYQDFYDDPLNDATDIYEHRSEGFSNGGTTIYYSWHSFPSDLAQMDVLTVSYYDDNIKKIGNLTGYDMPTDLNTLIVSETYLQSNNANTFNNLAVGLPTVSQVRTLGTNNWSTSVSHYDYKARLVHSGNVNSYLGSKDQIKNVLDSFTGRLISSTSKHEKTGVQSTIIVEDLFTYDHMDRLLTHSQSINGQSQETIVENSYDKMGQLVSKGVGGSSTATSRLQNVDYNYNVRGWLTDINKDGLNQNDLFSFNLKYNNPTQGTPLYNGNISQTKWKTASDGVLRSYAYEYDALNRIAKANYFGGYLRDFAAPGLDNIAENYSVGDVTYDKNGNITGLQRYGLYKNDINRTQYTAVDKVDALIYTYAPKSNQLVDVTDHADNVEENTLNGGFHDKYTDDKKYEYLDLNGNMTADRNKDISKITYNHLNLPKIVYINGGKIVYRYDATGLKLSKQILINGNSSYTYYAGNYIYEKDNSGEKLKFFSHPEGYIEKNRSNYDYVYQYKDHLGNIRLNYADSSNGLVIEEENNYYPFGLKHRGYNNVITGRDHKYGFGNKEEQDELGLDWIDITARNYDPALGRWMNIDPLAEQMRRHSPYNYAFDNPVYWTDPDGMAPESSDDWVKNKLTGKYEWNNEVSSASTTPEGYRYIGKSDHSIVKDLVGEKTTFTDETWDWGSVSHSSETTAHAKVSTSNGSASTSKMKVSLAADVTSNYNMETNVLSKEFNGININVQVSGSLGSAVTEGQGMTLKPLEVTANGKDIKNTYTPDKTGLLQHPEGTSVFNVKATSNQIQSVSGKWNVGISFEGIYSNVKSGTTNKLPGAFGLLLGTNHTYLDVNFEINNK